MNFFFYLKMVFLECTWKSKPTSLAGKVYKSNEERLIDTKIYCKMMIIQTIWQQVKYRTQQKTHTQPPISIRNQVMKLTFLFLVKKWNRFLQPRPMAIVLILLHLALLQIYLQLTLLRILYMLQSLLVISTGFNLFNLHRKP